MLLAAEKVVFQMRVSWSPKTASAISLPRRRMSTLCMFSVSSSFSAVRKSATAPEDRPTSSGAARGNGCRIGVMRQGGLSEVSG